MAPKTCQWIPFFLFLFFLGMRLLLLIGGEVSTKPMKLYATYDHFFLTLALTTSVCVWV